MKLQITIEIDDSPTALAETPSLLENIVEFQSPTGSGELSQAKRDIYNALRWLLRDGGRVELLDCEVLDETG